MPRQHKWTRKEREELSLPQLVRKAARARKHPFSVTWRKADGWLRGRAELLVKLGIFVRLPKTDNKERTYYRLADWLR